MTDLTCDVAIIGAGTAGLAAERSARKNGATTLLIDPEFIGTTCATVGCMPSKLLIAAAHRAHDARGTDTFGVHTGEVTVNGPEVMTRLRRLRDDFAGATRDSIMDLPDEIRIQSRAQFTGPTTLELEDGRNVSAKAVIIATGSSPMVPPPYRDLGDRLLTNDTLFELPDLPRRLAVIGGGIIGIELAQAMARLGVTVTLFDQSDSLGGTRDEGIHDALYDALSREMTLRLGTDPQPTALEAGLRIDWEGGSEEFDKVLVATGRPPNLKGLGLDATGLDLDDKGMPQVCPATLQCGDLPIFMVGDANADRPLLHEASDEGAIAGRNAVSFPALVPGTRKVPLAVTFTDPPLVTIGAAASEAAVTGTADYTDQGRAKVEDRATGLARLHADGEGRLIGADLFCPGADHMGHLLVLAITKGATAGDLLDLPIYHPTLEEGLRTALREICEAIPLHPPGDRDCGSPSGA